MIVYLDSHRLVNGDNWEECFSIGLLNSLSIFPLLSYGSTAPLAQIVNELVYPQDLTDILFSIIKLKLLAKF